MSIHQHISKRLDAPVLLLQTEILKATIINVCMPLYQRQPAATTALLSVLYLAALDDKPLQEQFILHLSTRLVQHVTDATQTAECNYPLHTYQLEIGFVIESLGTLSSLMR